MAKDNAAWFEDLSPKVEGFESTECPHGTLWVSEGNLYTCTNCTHVFEVTDLGPDEEDVRS